MCGIFGFIGPNSINHRRALEILDHRGPDDSGFWKAQSENPSVILGQTRLAIVDLNKRSKQPMKSKCGRYTLVYNGEIYNFTELKDDLKGQGVRFRTKSDTEVLLEGLIKYGTNFQKKCNGMWSFCLWDDKKKVGIFGRDRFGKKPFFYTVNNGTLFFASETKLLLEYSGTFSPIKDFSQFENLIFNYESSGLTPFNNVFSLKSGHSATWKNNEFLTSRWWNTLDNLVEVPSKYEDQVEEWRYLFLDSVKMRIASDVKVGTAISGGLDSTAIACAVKYLSEQNRVSLKEHHLYFSKFADYENDESAWLQIAQEALTKKARIIEIDPNKSFWGLQNSLFQTENPYLTIPIPMLETYKGMSKDGIKVSIDGHGADELFSGYGHIKQLILSCNFEEYKEIKAIEKSLGNGVYSEVRLSKLNFRLEKLYLKLRSFMGLAKRSLLFSKDFQKNFLNFDDRKHAMYKSFSEFDKNIYEIFHITILPTLLRNYDRYSMANGVEIRMPFMDHRLVSFTFSLPRQSKIGNTYTKRIMRDALKDILPKKIYSRRDKLGWNAPVNQWMKGQYKNEIHELITRKNTFFNPSLAQWNNFLAKSKTSYTDAEKVWKKYMIHIWWNAMSEMLKDKVNRKKIKDI